MEEEFCPIKSVSVRLFERRKTREDHLGILMATNFLAYATPTADKLIGLFEWPQLNQIPRGSKEETNIALVPSAASH